MKETYSVEDIKNVIPHRYPFLLIDRVTELKESEYIKGYKNITINEPIFQGHFPEKPIFPGVLIIEAMAQLGAFLLVRRFPEGKRMAYFAGIDKARFKRPVVPGDRLDLEVTVVKDRGHFAVMEGKALVEGDIAAQALLMSSVPK
jgi:beta-hydroxyacyl-ACP dehydratase FabZ